MKHNIRQLLYRGKRMSDQIATVKYQLGTYKGTVDIPCDENDDNEIIIARAKGKLRKMKSMPMYSESYSIIDRR